MLKVNLKYQLLFCSVLFFIKLSAQQEVKPFGVKTTYHYGFIAPHKEVVNEIIEGQTQVVEFSLFRNTTGDKQWSQSYRYPEIGLSLLYFDLANPAQLGKSFGIYPYIALTFGKGKISWENKIGAGLGYIEKPYNRINNYKNLVIGSTMNVLISVNTQAKLKLSEQMNTTVGLSFIHFSNGAYTMPNLGINMMSVNMGLAYQFGDMKAIVKNEPEDKERIWTKNITVGLGLKEILPVEGPKYVINTASFNVMKRRSNINSFGAGADFFYNSSLTEILSLDEAYVKSNADNIRVGITLIYVLDFGKISAVAQWGAYLYNQETKKGKLYTRYQIRYHANEKLFINLGLKTHRAVADFGEVGIGYQF